MTAPLAVRIGNQPGAAMRLKRPGDALLDHEVAHIWSGTIDDWKRVAVCTSTRGQVRYWVLEPAGADAPEDEIAFAGFYVRGRFRRVEVINSAKRAGEAFRAFVAT